MTLAGIATVFALCLAVFPARAQEDGQIHLGQVDARKWPDIRLATISDKKVEVKLVKGSVFDGIVTEKILHIAQVNSYCYSYKL